MNAIDDIAVFGERRCAPRQLAASELGSVEACFDCGTVRLNVGALSLRLEPEAFHALALMVGEAHIHLRRHAENVAAETAAKHRH